MDEFTKKLKVDIDYDEQSFEDMTLNPYEVVIAASKYAREINDKARKNFGAEVEIQPRNIAMRKIQYGEAKLVNDPPKKEE
jgi:DNA-directed RNA polymerase subunit K/omega